MSPISHFVRKDEAGKLADDDNNEVPVISSAFSPLLPTRCLSKGLAIEPEQILSCGHASAPMRGLLCAGLG